MVNVNRLRGKMVERGYNVETLSKAIGVNTSTLYRKLARSDDMFTIANATRIGKILQLSPVEMTEIFFDQKFA